MQREKKDNMKYHDLLAFETTSFVNLLEDHHQTGLDGDQPISGQIPFGVKVLTPMTFNE